MKKKLLTTLSVVLVLGLAALGILAYLTSEDSDVNVMTMGNVSIVQDEYERAVDADGEFVTKDDGYVLTEFTQDKPLYPSVGEVTGWDDVVVPFDQIGGEGNMQMLNGKENVVDKLVVVKNTGKTDAYVRTLIAYELGNLSYERWDEIFMTSKHNFWSAEDIGVAKIEGNNYVIVEYVYDRVLTAGAVSRNSLSQVYLKPAATNEDCAALDGNGNGTYDILVYSQAGQVAGFESVGAKEALNTMFYEVTTTQHPWVDGINWPGEPVYDECVEYNGTMYETLKDALAAANANGGGQLNMMGSFKLAETQTVGANITINGNGHQIERAEGFTGTMLNVATGATLTTEKLTMDGAGDTATGNLIATAGTGSIVLNEGTVLKNNNGAHAVSLATRGGGTLTMTGAEIINNSSGSGAIWGGGHITLNEGAKINNNTSTGIGGAIRMVSGYNLTMNEGSEICNNTAATDGGAIWGYGASNYDFNGGKMSGNTAGGVGGAIYTGTYSKIYIKDGFELCDNSADNSGAIRLTDHTSMTITGGKVSGNTQNGGESNAFNTWNNSISITGGDIDDNLTFVGGLGLTIGNADIDGVITYDLSTNHNTAYLTANFNSFKFIVNEEDEHFSNFNLKPATGYTYTEGDEAKLVCQNEGYETYWDANTGTFKLQAK